MKGVGVWGCLMTTGIIVMLSVPAGVEGVKGVGVRGSSMKGVIVMV